jgi:hypothetical protein
MVGCGLCVRDVEKAAQGHLDRSSKLRPAVQSEGSRHTKAGHPVVKESRGTGVGSSAWKGNYSRPGGGMVHNGQQVGETVSEWQPGRLVLGKTAGWDWNGLRGDMDMAVNLSLFAIL